MTQQDTKIAAFEKECKDNMFGNALNMYQRIASDTAIYPGQNTALGLIYVSLKGAGEAGEFAEHVGKALRDDGIICAELDGRNHPKGYTGGKVMLGPLTDERRSLLIKEIGDQLWYLAMKCNELEITLAEAALVNVHKLRDRQLRDKLQGSGDNR